MQESNKPKSHFNTEYIDEKPNKHTGSFVLKLLFDVENNIVHETSSNTERILFSLNFPSTMNSYGIKLA